MTTATAYTAKIGGTLVNVIAGTLNVENQIGQRSQGSIGVWSALGVRWQYGTQVLVYDETDARIVRTDTPPEERTKYNAIKAELGAALVSLVTPLKESAIAHDLSAGRTRVTMEIPRRHVRMVRTWLGATAPR